MFLLFLNCSAWPCLGPASLDLQKIGLISVVTFSRKQGTKSSKLSMHYGTLSRQGRKPQITTDPSQLSNSIGALARSLTHSLARSHARSLTSRWILRVVVNRKGHPALFLPKFSAEIRQKEFLIRKALSVYLQKLSLLAERTSFCRKTLFL